MAVPSILLPFLLAAPLGAQVAGTWKLASQPDLPALFEQATVSLTPVARAKARDRLKKINIAYPRIAITHAAGHITIRFDHRAQRMPDNALAVAWTREDGEKFLISARMEGESLIQTLMGEDGMLENHFHAKDGTLTLRVTVKAMELPRPITYTLTYKP